MPYKQGRRFILLSSHRVPLFLPERECANRPHLYPAALDLASRWASPGSRSPKILDTCFSLFHNKVDQGSTLVVHWHPQ